MDLHFLHRCELIPSLNGDTLILWKFIFILKTILRFFEVVTYFIYLFQRKSTEKKTCPIPYLEKTSL